MKILDYKTACVIAGYEYQLVGLKGKVYDIIEIDKGDMDFYIQCQDHQIGSFYIDFSEIGTKYWILARPLEELKKIGVKISEHGINTLLEKEFNIEYGVFNYYENNITFDIDGDPMINYDQFKSIDYKVFERVQEILLNNHFALNLEPEWWKPIKDQS